MDVLPPNYPAMIGRPEPADHHGDGCGTKGTQWAIPQFDFSGPGHHGGPCVEHDYEYSLGGAEADRRAADEHLRDNIQAVIDATWSPSKKLFYGAIALALTGGGVANAYYNAVRALGWMAFPYRDPAEAVRVARAIAIRKGQLRCVSSCSR